MGEIRIRGKREPARLKPRVFPPDDPQEPLTLRAPVPVGPKARPRPDTPCACCGGPLPKYPEWDDHQATRRFYCSWRCCVTQGAREARPDDVSIARLMCWPA